VSADRVGSWFGTEKSVIDAHPAMRAQREDMCTFMTALRAPSGGHDDRPILAMRMFFDGRPANLCEPAESLAKIILRRLPSA